MKKYFIIILFFSFNLYSQTYIPGKSYFGRNNYTEYIAGSLPIIISASHGGDPSSIEFFHKVGMNYVSCSPFRVPIARLASAQAVVKSKN